MLLPQLLGGINNIDFLEVICFQTIIILIHFSFSNFYCSLSILRCKGKEFPVYLSLGQDNTVEADVSYVKWYLPSCPSKTAKGMEILAMSVSPAEKSVSLREKLIAASLFAGIC